jgi:hypothetical protein
MEIETQDRGNEPEGSLIKEIRMFVESVAIVIDAVKKGAREIAAGFQPTLDQLRANFEQLPTRTKEVQRKLAERGWYLLPQMPFALAPLENAFSAQRPDLVDEALSTFVEQNVDGTESNLCTEFPHRMAIFKEAFQSHREARYASSITLLLTQADGMVIEVLGKSFFSKERNSQDPRTRKLIEDLQLGLYIEILLEPLMSRGGISAGDQELGQYPDSVHRHQILHGIDTTYPSKLNSLKVITLVGYLGGLAKGIILQGQAKALTATVSE